MMTMTNKTRAALACLLLAGAGAGAQEPKPDPPKKEDAAPARVVPLQLQIVLSRYRGEQKLSSLPYTLVLASNMSSARIRMGVQLPIRMGPEPGIPQYRDVGTNLDCNAAALDLGRFRVSCTFEQSSAYSATATGGADTLMPTGGTFAAPLFRSFRSEATLILADGQTGLHTSAADPVNGELLKAEVTLRVIR